ncbi:hypothetical protein [Yunchengibacter salinarum]|uniref:hypothetical protein n=1 Tax=Yunchengibacter salinarum TaxID=3133399 RepID=UPI0035B598DC
MILPKPYKIEYQGRMWLQIEFESINEIDSSLIFFDSDLIDFCILPGHQKDGIFATPFSLNEQGVEPYGIDYVILGSGTIDWLKYQRVKFNDWRFIHWQHIDADTLHVQRGEIIPSWLEPLKMHLVWWTGLNLPPSKREAAAIADANRIIDEMKQQVALNLSCTL